MLKSVSVFVLIALSLALTAPASAQLRREFLPADPKDVARQLCEKVFSGKPFKAETIFTESFLRSVPVERLLTLLKGVRVTAGVCSSSEILVESVLKHGDEGHARARLATDLRNNIIITFQFTEEGLVAGLLVDDIEFPNVVLRTWSDVAHFMNRLPGRTSLTAGSFDGRPVGIRSHEVQPMGSTFKLYVLKALEDAIASGRRRWTEAFPIRKEWKSLPSGTMQNLPVGQTVTLQNFAEAMIRDSDNTATDHLIHILGRETVEATVGAARHHKPEMMQPFLTTQEMFKLKWGLQQTATWRYLQMKTPEKKAFLNREVFNFPLEAVGTNGVSTDLPTLIRYIEWFGTTNDMCLAMESFTKRRDRTVLQALSLRTPFVSAGPNQRWLYAGYKGGSEPGVIAMTYLLLDRRGRWQCLSAAWSNEYANINEWVFSDIIRKSLAILERMP